MPAWESYSYIFGPLVAFSAIGLFIVILKWSSQRGKSVVAAPARSGTEADYGLLVVVSRPPNYADGEIQRRTLEDAGIKATLAYTLDGPRLMVWPADAERATELISS